MKYLKWLLFVPVAIVPCLVMLGGTPWLGLVLAFALAAALTILLTYNHWTGKELACTILLLKIFYLFPYVFMIQLYYHEGPFGFLSLALLMCAFFSFPPSLTGLAAVLRCRREGRLTHTRAVVYGILQFVFLADVVCAILLCRAAFKKEDS